MQVDVIIPCIMISQNKFFYKIEIDGKESITGNIIVSDDTKITIANIHDVVDYLRNDIKIKTLKAILKKFNEDRILISQKYNVGY